ncbi:4'-phosphopantetheinyl transferase family protein [Tamaricihabitans halophyticus]|nr:4'-phosphopantetheinyl transferase superfamily protein [Tamaricihabitans halophyticus]
MSTGVCTVWFSQPLPLDQQWLELLDELEHGRLAAYRQEVDKRRFLTGRVLAKTVLAARDGRRPETIRLDASCADCDKPHGPPRLPEPDAPQLSIAHSGERVALAVCSVAAVGVDVERIGESVRAGMYEHVLSAQERPRLDRLTEDERARAFFGYWARKEALIKACRLGLRLPMPELTVSSHDSPARLLASTSAALHPASTTMHDLDAGEGYRASLAVLTAEAIQPKTKWWHPEPEYD